jgi:hypothetical protein
MSRSNTRLVVTALCFCICGSEPICGRDVFVTVGGGPDPASNQVSLEKNVEYVSQVLANNYPSPLDHRILFADGSASDPDTQFIDDTVEPSPAMKWMCRIIGEEDWISLRYRNSHLTTEASPANKQRLNQLMQELAEELGQGDRLVLYVAAHGGPAHLDELNDDDAEANPETSEHARDTSIVLWGDEELRASEFTDWLDRFSPDVDVLVVMVQCYSGGFAEIVFQESDRRFGLSERPRCGFFSQRHDRASAGCTPAIDEADYQEYSSFFWAALNARSRSSNEAVQADYDKDGRVSMAEAHAYAMITCNTIDVPLKTSDVVLRKYSKLEVEPAESEPPNLMTSVLGGWFSDSNATDNHSKATSLDRSIDELLSLSSADQREVIVQLASTLELTQDRSLRQIQRQRRKLTTRIDNKYSELTELSNSETTLIAEIRRSLNRANPEFREQGFSPIITEWTSVRSDEFVELIESFEESKSLVQVQSQMESLTNLIDELERREAKLERLILTLQNVLLQANLVKVADEATVERIQNLLELENSAFW